MKQAIHAVVTPQAIGTYAQALRCGDSRYLAGQTGRDPATMQLVDGVDVNMNLA